MAVTLNQTLSKDVTPKVGETWLCDVVLDGESTQQRVRVTWASKDGRVFEGMVIRPKKIDAKVNMYRGLLRERVS